MGKSTWKTHGLDGECTLLWLKQRYPSHTQELDLLSLLFLSSSSGDPQKYPTDTSLDDPGPASHCVSD